MTTDKSKRSKTAKVDQLLAVLTGLTGLNLDDILKELEGTDEEKAKAQMENMIKMAEHMKINPRSLDDLS
jgi:DNA polymerase II small subunit/DNA polymerase delta subunit B